MDSKIEMPDIDMNKIKRDAKSCWEKMNDDGIKINISFSFVDLMMIAAGTVVIVSSLKMLSHISKSICIKKEAKSTQ